MVPKESGFNQSETLAAYARAACIAWSFTVLYAHLQRKGMDCRTGELKYKCSILVIMETQFAIQTQVT